MYKSFMFAAGNHLGIVRMKMLARSYFWWPSLDETIEDYVKQCD